MAMDQGRMDRYMRLLDKVSTVVRTGHRDDTDDVVHHRYDGSRDGDEPTARSRAGQEQPGARPDRRGSDDEAA